MRELHVRHRRAVLVGATESANLGDRLMSDVAHALLRSLGFTRVRRAGHWDRPPRFRRRAVDAIFDLGNVHYCTCWSRPFADAVAASLALRRRLPAARTVFLPCGWGPYTEAQFPDVRALVDGAVVFARDRLSLAHLEAAAPGAARFCPDLAFLCAPAPPAPRGARPRLGVVPNHRCVEPGVTPLADPAAYPRLLAAAVRWGRERGYEVVGISHMLGTNRDAKLLEGLGVPVVAVDGAASVRAAIASLDLAVVSRYHGLVNCLVHGVPAVSLGWQHKYRGLMDVFGLGAFDHPLAEPAAALRGRLETLHAERIAVTEHIETGLGDARATIRRELAALGAALPDLVPVRAAPIATARF